jgi:hypothetical protein
VRVVVNTLARTGDSPTAPFGPLRTCVEKPSEKPVIQAVAYVSSAVFSVAWSVSHVVLVLPLQTSWK